MTPKSLKSFLEVLIFFTDGEGYFRDESGNRVKINQDRARLAGFRFRFHDLPEDVGEFP